MKDITTTDLAKFGYVERKEAIRLLQAWNEQGLPEDFDDSKVEIMFNKNSGFVFLSNEDYQTALMNGDKLESWYNCPNCGNEGFREDCCIDENGTCQCCNEGE